MKSIELEGDHQYPTLNTDLLGRPIHTIREELRKILEGSVSGIQNQIQKWLLNYSVSFHFNEITLHFPEHAEAMQAASTFCHQQGGLLSIQLEKASLLGLSDHFYGAAIHRANASDTSALAGIALSNSDLRLQQRLGRLIADAIAPDDMWQSMEAIPSNDVGLLVRFTLTCESQSGTLSVLLDGHLIQTLINELELQPQDPAIPHRFRHALEKTPVSLQAVLSRKVMPLSQVLALQPGDIIPIDLLTQAPVSIGQEHLFNGQVADQNGQLVLILKETKDSHS